MVQVIGDIDIVFSLSTIIYMLMNEVMYESYF